MAPRLPGHGRRSTSLAAQRGAANEPLKPIDQTADARRLSVFALSPLPCRLCLSACLSDWLMGSFSPTTGRPRANTSGGSGDLDSKAAPTPLFTDKHARKTSLTSLLHASSSAVKHPDVWPCAGATNEKARLSRAFCLNMMADQAASSSTASSSASAPSASASALGPRRGPLARAASISLTASVSVMRLTAAISRDSRSNAAS